jgi:ribose/xylose/arabinose/galactoside ABC-type transport system permease subunit
LKLPLSEKSKRFIEEYNILIMLILFLIATTFATNGQWLAPGNILNIISRVAILGILSMAQCVVLLTGQIDLSISSLFALFCSIYSAILLSGFNIMLGLGLAAVVVLLIGALNGFLAAKTTIPSFVITLGTMMIFRSLHYYALGSAKYVPQIQNIIYGLVGSLPGARESFPIIAWIFIFLVLSFVLGSTQYGKHVYAVGGSTKVAMITGVSVSKIKMSVFMVSAALTALAAFVYLYRVANVAPNTGESYLLDTIAAPIIGGVYLFGGRGKLWKALMGALFLEILANFMRLIGINPYIFQAVEGGIIAVGVVISIWFIPSYLRAKTRL